MSLSPGRYIRQLVTVSCFNAVGVNLWRLFCRHFNKVFLFFLRLTSTMFGPSSKEGTTGRQSSPSSSRQRGALWLTWEAQSSGCACGWWRWGCLWTTTLSSERSPVGQYERPLSSTGRAPMIPKSRPSCRSLCDTWSKRLRYVYGFIVS